MTSRGPLIVTGWSLTGTVRHRRNWRGKMILQIQEIRTSGFSSPFEIAVYDFPEYRWRDAGARDLTSIERLFGSRIKVVRDQ